MIAGRCRRWTDGRRRDDARGVPAGPVTRAGRDLRYGENPHQKAAWYRSESTRSLPAWHVLQGKELSYTNLLDLDAALRIALEFAEPAAVVIKHTNPCGVGARQQPRRRLRSGARSRSAVGVRRHRRPEPDARRRDGAALTSTFIEAVIAPVVDDEARAILATQGRTCAW